MRRFLLVVISVFIWLTSGGSWAQEGRESEHAELSALLVKTQQAFNTENFNLMRPLIAKDNFTVVTIDGHKFESLAAFREYWIAILKENKTGLERIEVNPVADGPTQFLAENVGVCHGISNDRYFFTNGDIRTMPERWTSVLVKEDGAWKVSKIIFSANILDNPVLAGTKVALQNFIIWAALAGLVIGALGMWLFRCRKVA